MTDLRSIIDRARESFESAFLGSLSAEEANQLLRLCPLEVFWAMAHDDGWLRQAKKLQEAEEAATEAEADLAEARDDFNKQINTLKEEHEAELERFGLEMEQKVNEVRTDLEEATQAYREGLEAAHARYAELEAFAVRVRAALAGLDGDEEQRRCLMGAVGTKLRRRNPGRRRGRRSAGRTSPAGAARASSGPPPRPATASGSSTSAASGSAEGSRAASATSRASGSSSRKRKPK